MQLAIETEGKIYEISELVHSVSFTDKLNNGCSKLEFSYINDNVVITNGSVVQFIYDEIKFYGIVFKVGRNAKGEVDVTAYDQLRYAKAKDTIMSKGETITSHVKKMCNYLGLIPDDNLLNTGYVLATDPKDDKTWLDILYEDIQDTLTGTGRYYMIRDETGKVCIRNLEDYRLNLVLGDESLCYDFGYEKSIDDKTYNIVKLASANETTGKRDVYIAKDNNAIEKYGTLQYFEKLDKNANASQAKAKTDALLNLYNRETETLSLECLGDTNIRAGCSFYAKIADLSLQKWLIVSSVTHKFLPVHTMSIEAML